MADNICFPAKLLHGHIFDLMGKGIDRIFFPYVVYEKLEKGSQNSFNCPIVAGYSDVIKSAINTSKRSNIPLDSPVINFKDINQLKEIIETQLYKKLYTNDYISESEYKNLCQEK